jgi:hypothetical protein
MKRQMQSKVRGPKSKVQSPRSKVLTAVAFAFALAAGWCQGQVLWQVPLSWQPAMPWWVSNPTGTNLNLVDFLQTQNTNMAVIAGVITNVALLNTTNTFAGSNFFAAGLTANGVVLRQISLLPTNSIPLGATGITNWVLLNMTNAGPILVATNAAAGTAGSFQKITFGTPAAWP